MSIGVVLVLQLGFVYLPFMQNVFQTGSLSAWQWAAAVVAGAVVVPAVSAEKYLRRPR